MKRPEGRRPDDRFAESRAAGSAQWETTALPECARRTDFRADHVVREVNEPHAAADREPAGDCHGENATVRDIRMTTIGDYPSRWRRPNYTATVTVFVSLPRRSVADTLARLPFGTGLLERLIFNGNPCPEHDEVQH